MKEQDVLNNMAIGSLAENACRMALALALILLIAPALPTHAETTFTVTSEADANDTNPGDGSCADETGACTLRAAISEANDLGGADTITLPAGTYTLTIAGSGESSNATGDLDIRSDITINGAGADVTFIQAGTDSTNGIDRVFHVVSGAEATISGVTIRYGKAPDSTNQGGRHGGGIYNAGTLTIQDSTVSGNHAGYGNDGGGDGGGIYSPGPSLTIQNSIVSDNQAGNAVSGSGGDGGGLHVWALYPLVDTVTIQGSTVSSNRAGDGAFGGACGGAYIEAGTVTIDDSTISNNYAGDGGDLEGDLGGYYGGMSIMLVDGLTIRNSTISDNHAGATNGDVGGLRVEVYEGLSSPGATTTLTNLTVSGNSGLSVGGILFQHYASYAASFQLSHSTITNNTATQTEAPDSVVGGINVVGLGSGAATLELENSIVAGNRGGTDADCLASENSEISSLGYNLVGAGCPTDGTTDLTPTDPGLAPLADNGGPTWTHALLPDSPGVDAIPYETNGCGTDYTLDQRGEPRPYPAEGSCDIGAYELQVAGYDFSGFFPPVDNPPALNGVKAGRAIPVKFSLNGDQGLDVFDAGFPASQPIPCDGLALVYDVEETVTAGSSSLSYDATTDQYIYVWKTEKGWVGTCRQLTVQLNDGTTHVAYFSFGK
jgi:CSLREA domain-containing protein